MEMELLQGDVSGEVVPGSSIAVSPTIKNTGTKQVLAFVKVEMPTYSAFTGEQKAAYTFSPDSEWIKVADDGATVVCFYKPLMKS